jgi:hypothetical protein
MFAMEDTHACGVNARLVNKLFNCYEAEVLYHVHVSSTLVAGELFESSFPRMPCFLKSTHRK